MRKRLIRSYIWITLGSLGTALALDLFLVPNRIAAGGVSGLATILYHLLGIPVGWTLLAINIPLFFLSYRELGFQVVVRSLYGAVATSIFVEVLAPRVPALTGDLLLASVYGGIVAGFGMGIVLRAHGTTGGTDLVARLISKYLPVTVGQALLGADFVVISLAGVFFNAELALYALLGLLATSKVVDLVQEGISYAKAAFIISVRSQEVARAIFRELERGVTSLQGEGMYTGEKRPVLLCVVAKSEESRLKEVIYEVDARAFVFITDAHEVLGEGFKIPR
ncbi:MAG: YitT family protein [Bacillota bacterium]|nr:YitT family protein [Bacillota bacterium]